MVLEAPEDFNELPNKTLPTAKIDKKIMDLALIPYVDYDIVITE